MVSLIVRGLLLLSGTVTGWFVARDAPNFSFIQGMVSLVVIAVIVFVIAFWPARWSHLLDRHNKPESPKSATEVSWNGADLSRR